MMVGGLESLAAEIEEAAKQTHNDTSEPIDNFLDNYTSQAQTQIMEVHELYMGFAEINNKVEDSKHVYMGQKEVAEKSNLRIEESMLSFELGEIDVEKVQSISK